jgi:hypothetical protein
MDLAIIPFIKTLDAIAGNKTEAMCGGFPCGTTKEPGIAVGRPFANIFG